MMIWAVAATFFREEDAATMRWLDDFVPPSDRRSFVKLGRPGPEESWHGRRSRATPVRAWAQQVRQATRCLKADGIVTVFPPLAVVVGLLQRLRGTRKPHLAWCFNMGSHPGGVRQRLARLAASRIDLFVVHSRAEIETVATYLDIPRDRVRFVPLQTSVRPSENLAAPDEYLISMGSANRDYATFFEAIRSTGLPSKVIASPRVIEGLDVPENVEILSGLSLEESRQIAASARMSVIPLLDPKIASGQVTLVDAAALGQCIVATRSDGTVDYVADDEDGILVPPRDSRALAQELLDAWHDDERRQRLGQAARRRAEREYSDAAAASALDALLNEISARR
jgi:glycosyltransferase involved in cell wall biosynthesis